MRPSVDYKNSKLCIDIGGILEAMNEEDTKHFIKTFSIQESVISYVIDYICGDDEDGCWTSMDAEYRMSILQRIEHKQLSEGPRHSWTAWSEICQELKNIRCKQQIYWKLYHNGSWGEVTLSDGSTKSLEFLISDWLTKCGIESNYTTKEADKDIARIEKLVINALTEMRKENERNENQRN